MSQVNIRMATLDDAEALHKLMHRAFTPLREVGIDWPSVNATLEMIQDNIQNNAAYVLEVEGKLFQPCRYVFHGSRVSQFLNIRLFGGLRQTPIMAV